MVNYNIDNIIECVLLRGIDNNYSNSSNSFSFKNKIFYSYEEPIAELTDTILNIYPKTAKDGYFYSRTTSKHISKIKVFCENNNINYRII